MRKIFGYFVVFAVLAWGGLSVLWRGYGRQQSDAYMERLATVIVVLVYELVVALVTKVLWCICIKRQDETWSRISIHEEGFNENIDVECNGLELPTYKNTDPPETFEAESDTVGRHPQPVSHVTVHRGRPTCPELLEGLTDGLQPALFCCVPHSLSRSLEDSVGQRMCTCSSRNVAFYKESFEI